MSSVSTSPVNALKMEQLGYVIANEVIFKNLSQHFLPGISVIMGPNGAGKSTLLRLLSRISLPTTGKITLSNKNDSYEKCRIGYVPAVPCLYPYLSVRENFILIATLQGCAPEAALTGLANQHLDRYQHCIFARLSDGIQKRVTIASQLIAQPRLLILDEPCNALDPYARQQLFEQLAQLRTPERFIIFSSHHPQECYPWCDNLYLLLGGKLECCEKIPQSALKPLAIAES